MGFFCLFFLTAKYWMSNILSDSTRAIYRHTQTVVVRHPQDNTSNSLICMKHCGSDVMSLSWIINTRDFYASGQCYPQHVKIHCGTDMSWSHICWSTSIQVIVEQIIAYGRRIVQIMIQAIDSVQILYRGHPSRKKCGPRKISLWLPFSNMAAMGYPEILFLPWKGSRWLRKIIMIKKFMF